MEDPTHHYALDFNPVEHDVSPVLHTPQAGPDLVAGAAQFRLVHESLAARFKRV
jgi:hypothetical protein